MKYSYIITLTDLDDISAIITGNVSARELVTAAQKAVVRHGAKLVMSERVTIEITPIGAAKTPEDNR